VLKAHDVGIEAAFVPFILVVMYLIYSAQHILSVFLPIASVGIYSSDRRGHSSSPPTSRLRVRARFG
jgi:hypothetical protein